MKVLIRRCDLDLEHSEAIFTQDRTGLMEMHHQAQFDSKRIRSLENRNSHILILEPYDPDLEDGNPISSHDALALMMSHHTKYGSKGFSGTEDVVWTNTNFNFKRSL